MMKTHQIQQLNRYNILICSLLLTQLIACCIAILGWPEAFEFFQKYDHYFSADKQQKVKCMKAFNQSDNATSLDRQDQQKLTILIIKLF